MADRRHRWDRPSCHWCGKGLVWSVAQLAKRGVVRMRRRDVIPKLAIRCLDCHAVFCSKCARRHFAPMMRAEQKVARALERAAMRAMQKVRGAIRHSPDAIVTRR